MKNPLQFIEEVRQETSKVTWPTWKEVWITTIMVLIMVALTSTFFLLADVVISRIIGLVQPATADHKIEKLVPQRRPDKVHLRKRGALQAVGVLKILREGQ